MIEEPAVDAADASPPDEPERETLRERVTVFQYAAMERVAMEWPERMGRAGFEAYVRALHAAVPSLRNTVARNLSRILGRPPDSEAVAVAVREAFHLYGRYWYETFRVRVMPPEEVNKRFVCEGLEHIERALEEGRGAILALPHMGNWDVAGRFLCVNGYRLAAVAEQLRPRRIFRNSRAAYFSVFPWRAAKIRRIVAGRRDSYARPASGPP